MNIVLIGMMGCGKSTIGPILAQEIAYTFLDTDTEIEHQNNQSIADIFSEQGEAFFRQEETRILKEVLLGHRQVLATGGGLVLSSENRTLIKESYVIYLSATVELLAQRLSADTASRPLLMGTDIKATLEHLLKQREAIYRQSADGVIELIPDKGGLEISNEIINHLRWWAI